MIGANRTEEETVGYTWEGHLSINSIKIKTIGANRTEEETIGLNWDGKKVKNVN